MALRILAPDYIRTNCSLTRFYIFCVGYNVLLCDVIMFWQCRFPAKIFFLFRGELQFSRLALGKGTCLCAVRSGFKHRTAALTLSSEAN